MDIKTDTTLKAPENCIIKNELKINTIDSETGEADISNVNRCVPLLVKNVVKIYQIGNNVKIVFQPVTIAEGVDTHQVYEYNTQSGWKDSNGAKQNNQSIESTRTSVSRTKRTINELVACNDWKYFVTITLAPQKWDRYTASEELKRAFSNNAKRWKRKNKLGVAKVPNFKFLMIPELHEDGAIHLHGFITDAPENTKIPYTLAEINGSAPIPAKICEMVRGGENVYHCSEWDTIFGYNSLTELKNADKAASYVTKYVTKALNTPIFKVKYWCSRGLKKAKQIGKFYISDDYKDLFLHRIHEMSVETKKGKKMYYETDTSIISTDNPTSNTSLLTVTAFINNYDYSTNEILNFTNLIAEKEILYANKPKETFTNAKNHL